jgi:hypothetical protein
VREREKRELGGERRQRREKGRERESNGYKWRESEQSEVEREVVGEIYK